MGGVGDTGSGLSPAYACGNADRGRNNLVDIFIPITRIENLPYKSVVGNAQQMAQSAQDQAVRAKGKTTSKWGLRKQSMRSPSSFYIFNLVQPPEQLGPDLVKLKV